MNYERLETGEIRARKVDELSGVAVQFLARDVRRERTGVHAWLAIKLGDRVGGYDNFNVEKDAERVRLANSAHKVLGNGEAATAYPALFLKRDLDEFCDGLWPQHVGRIQAERLAGNPNLGRPVEIVKPWVYAGAGTIFAGPPGRGKSNGLLAIGVIADAGLVDTPLGSAPTPVPTLFVNIERSRESMIHRLARVNAALGLDPRRELGFINQKGRTFADVLDAIRIAIRNHGYRFVILDSISRSGYGALNEDVTANRIIDALNGLGVAWAGVGHTPRGDETHLFGSIHFEAGCDVMVMMAAEKDERTGAIGVAFKMTKANDVPIAKPMFVRYEFAEDGSGLAAIRAARADDFVALSAGFASAHDRIVAYLREAGQATGSELAEELNLDRYSVLRALKDNRFVKLPRDGKRQPYALAAHGEPETCAPAHVPHTTSAKERVQRDTLLSAQHVSGADFESGAADEGRIVCAGCTRSGMTLAGYHPSSTTDAERPLCPACYEEVLSA